MIHYTAHTIKHLFTPLELIAILKEGIIQYAQGNYRIPERTHIQRGESTNLIMPAFGPEYFCTKLISVDPNNHTLNLPAISGLLVLNDNHTGQTIATMDAPMITALRTAAVGSIGLDLIIQKPLKNLGIIGLGVQGLWQTIFVASSQNISQIYCTSRTKKKYIDYEKSIKSQFPKLTINWCSTPEEVVAQSQAILCCTTSTTPVFETKGLDISNKKFLSIGSFAPNMQELPNQVYQSADALLIDTETAKKEVGDVLQVQNQKWINASSIITLSNVLSGKSNIDNFNSIVFKSVGMAAFDLALASAVFKTSQS